MPNDPTVQQAAAELARLSIGGASEEEAFAAVHRYALSIPIPTRGQSLEAGLLVAGRVAHEMVIEHNRIMLRMGVTNPADVTDTKPDPAAGLPTMNCRSCGQLMIMVPHWKSGQASPLQADPGGEIVIESGRWKTVGKAGAGDDRPRYTTHFATCPEAAKFRRH